LRATPRDRSGTATGTLTQSFANGVTLIRSASL
jgi:hypothetical protein